MQTPLSLVRPKAWRSAYAPHSLRLTQMRRLPLIRLLEFLQAAFEPGTGVFRRPCH